MERDWTLRLKLDATGGGSEVGTSRVPYAYSAAMGNDLDKQNADVTVQQTSTLAMRMIT